MRTEVKICGIRTPATLDAAVEAGADWIGLVFVPRSPRHVTAADAASLAARLPSRVRAVGLFVAPGEAEIEAVLDIVPLAALQVYDHADRVTELAARLKLPIWHAVPIDRRDELPSGTSASRLVIEARGTGIDRPGGHGTRLDWSIMRDWTPPSPWMLAGGLTPENVGEALRSSGACAVDVSSGVESSPGVKDPGLIRSFVEAARAA